MEDLPRYLKNAQNALDAKRGEAKQRTETSKERQLQLHTLIPIEWRSLLDTMRTITRDKVFDGKQFDWPVSNSVVLGGMGLTLTGFVLPFKATLRKCDGSVEEIKIEPQLDGQVLRWTTFGWSPISKCSTEDLAIYLVKQLVEMYKATQVARNNRF
jgi:hypothetical protein